MEEIELEFGRNRRSLEMKGGGEWFGWDRSLNSESEESRIARNGKMMKFEGK